MRTPSPALFWEAPRFESGDPIRKGDLIVTDSGEILKVSSVRITDNDFFSLSVDIENGFRRELCFENGTRIKRADSFEQVAEDMKLKPDGYLRKVDCEGEKGQ